MYTLQKPQGWWSGVWDGKKWGFLHMPICSFVHFYFICEHLFIFNSVHWCPKYQKKILPCCCVKWYFCPGICPDNLQYPTSPLPSAFQLIVTLLHWMWLHCTVLNCPPKMPQKKLIFLPLATYINHVRRPQLTFASTLYYTSTYFGWDITPHCTALHYNLPWLLHYTVLHCNLLWLGHYTTLNCTSLQLTLATTLHCTTLQLRLGHYTTLHCTTLQLT